MRSTDSAVSWKTDATISKASRSPARARWRPLFAFAGIAGLVVALQSAAAISHEPNFKTDLAPQVLITSTLDGDLIAPGTSQYGAGNPNGAGFTIVAEIRTRDKTRVTVDEDVNIRHVAD